MRVAITGASGLIGSALSERFRRDGEQVIAIVRNRPTIPGVQVRWDPERGDIDLAALENLDVLIHLAGESIAGVRWTAAKKRRIRESRLKGTTLISSAIAQLDSPPAVFLSASAIGYYGSRPPHELLDETSGRGIGFLPDVAEEWERATAPALAAGVRVVHTRFGNVLTARGGYLAPVGLAFRLGVGGRFGSGRQMISWIAMEDLVRAARFAIATPELRGAVNFVAPTPVSNAELTRVLARVLRRPAVFHMPAAVVRLGLGEMGEELLLGGAAVIPWRLESAGFVFEFPELEPALRHVFGRAA